MSLKKFGGLLAIVLASCNTTEEKSYGYFYNPNSEHSLKDKKVKILYSTKDRIDELKISKNGEYSWPKPADPELIELVTRKLIKDGAYVSFFPILRDSPDLSFRLCQYERNWDALIVTDWGFDPKFIREENIDLTYLAAYNGKEVKIGKLGLNP